MHTHIQAIAEYEEKIYSYMRLYVPAILPAV